MRNVFSYLKPYHLAMGIALFLMFVELFVELFHPFLMAKIIDDGIMQEDLSVVLKWGGIMMGLSLVAFTAGIINSFYAAHVSQSFGYDVRRAIFKKVQSFSFANFNRFPTSSLITRMTNDITQMQNTIFMSLRIMLRAPLIVLGGTIMALIINAKLAIFLLISIPLLLAFMLWVMKKGGQLFRSVQERLDGVNNVMRENLVGIRLIKAFLRRDHEAKRFTEANEKLKDRTVKALRFMEISMPVLLLVMNLGIIGVLWFGSFEVTTNNATVGEVVAVVNYVMRITAVFSIFSWIIMAFSRAKASANRISDVLHTENEDDFKYSETVFNETQHQAQKFINGDIAFNQVFFKYPETKHHVLEQLTFEVKAGGTVAILGATGSGKSSLFQLIPRLYEPSSGEIYIDGKNIREFDIKMLRKQIGYVPQEAHLFSGTIQENIAWGKENASMDDIIAAAVHAQIHDTIVELPNGYNTVLGQKGVNLSGGQKQRLSIARALVREPKILLLDDSTSALDLKTEAQLLNAIEKYACTTLIITQKISTAMKADKIILLDGGKILTEGNHETLLQHSDLYQQIYRSQFGEEALHYVKTNH